MTARKAVRWLRFGPAGCLNRLQNARRWASAPRIVVHGVGIHGSRLAARQKLVSEIAVLSWDRAWVNLVQNSGILLEENCRSSCRNLEFSLSLYRPQAWVHAIGCSVKYENDRVHGLGTGSSDLPISSASP